MFFEGFVGSRLGGEMIPSRKCRQLISGERGVGCRCCGEKATFGSNFVVLKRLILIIGHRVLIVDLGVKTHVVVLWHSVDRDKKNYRDKLNGFHLNQKYKLFALIEGNKIK